jgi:hypothetical protein
MLCLCEVLKDIAAKGSEEAMGSKVGNELLLALFEKEAKAFAAGKLALSFYLLYIYICR